jgi:tryptophan synthase beta subunit
LAYLCSQKGKLSAETVAVVNLSGRGDKDVGIVEKYRNTSRKKGKKQ